MEKTIKMEKHGCFTKKGGYFPVTVKHKDTIHLFCRTGAGHLGRYGKIAVLSSDNGIDWRQLGTVEKPNTDIRNPAAYIFPNGKMLLALYKYNAYNARGICSPSENSNPNNYELLFFLSEDGGISWKEQNNVNKSQLGEDTQKSPHGNMIFYNNQILLPIYCKDGCFLVSSKDNGKSWAVFSHIDKDLGETFVAINAKNELVAVMRSAPYSRYRGASLISIYKNNKWAEPAAITEPNQHPAHLFLLSDNRLLLTYSDRNCENQRILAKLSFDDGYSWSSAFQIGESFYNCDFGYPSTVELKDGKLLTVFYSQECNNPYFNFGNPDYYDNTNAKGYYYLYSL